MIASKRFDKSSPAATEIVCAAQEVSRRGPHEAQWRPRISRPFGSVGEGPPPVAELNGPPVLGGNVFSGFTISPDGSRVVYRGDLNNEVAWELFSAPIDGSSTPVKLSRSLHTGGDVYEDFAISSDGRYVVYMGDLDVNNQDELFSAPIDGSSTPVKLNGPLVGSGHVEFGFAISPDGSHVVYLADQDIFDVFELFSAPIDGSSLPAKLNGPLVEFGDVHEGFMIGPDGSRVVYLADQEVDGQVALFSTSLSRPFDPDRDGDGLCDGPGSVAGVCVSGEDLNANGIVDAGETSPTNADTDNDGLPDGSDPDPLIPELPARFVACEDGLTVADTETGLLWERKNNGNCPGGVCGVNLTFTWSANTTGNPDPAGTVYTVFLASLNAGGGFAGHTDWDLPVISELQSILVGNGVTTASTNVVPLDPAMGTNPTG
jgi:hypothetical protein